MNQEQCKMSDNFSDLPQEKIGAVCAFCYYDGKFILVKNGGLWQPVAGHVEEGETAEQALTREIKEESNTQLLKSYPLGYFYVSTDDYYSTWYLCEVIPYGPFVSDPDGGVTEIIFVDFNEITKYLAPDDIGNLLLKRCEEVWRNMK